MIRLKNLRSCLKDERGVSAIEFAMLVPVLATLILGIIDLSTGLSQRFSLQQAVNRSLEIVQANRVKANDQGTQDYNFLKKAVVDGAPGASVTLTQWLECSGTKQGDYEGACAANQDTARYLELRATRVFQGKIYLRPVTLTATSAVRVQ
ncbi:MAG TPA: TadE/TadG family type IV pilus assembly protein [Allosphingosinicella sp.]|jgi:Flp pilus assembly protein TadG